MTSLFRLSAFASALLLAGCITVGPDYHRPVEKPVALQGVDAAQQSARHFQANWWAQFNDQTLDALIKRAAKNSPDLKIALARLNQSRAQLGTAAFAAVPDVQAQTSYTRSREQQPGFTTDPETITTYQAGFDASWELDLFGGIRRSVEAARAGYRSWRGVAGGCCKSRCSPRWLGITSICVAPQLRIDVAQRRYRQPARFAQADQEPRRCRHRFGSGCRQRQRASGRSRGAAAPAADSGAGRYVPPRRTAR